MLLSLTIFTALYGGSSHADDRTMFRVIITRPNTDITTQMRVWAENEEEARENVALNGWQILSIEKYSPGSIYRGTGDSQSNQAETAAQTTDVNVIVSKVGEGDIQPFGKQTVKSGDSIDFKLKPAPCQTLEKLAVNGELVDVTDTYQLANIIKDTYVVAFFNKNGNECEKNKIDDSDLKEIAVVYFNLGKFKTSIPEDVKSLVKGLSKKKKYVIIGHTDDVRVIPNVEYKDNMELSNRRAKFVKNSLGFDSDVKLMGMGPAYPVAPNKKDGQPLNRRAVIYERR